MERTENDKQRASKKQEVRHKKMRSLVRQLVHLHQNFGVPGVKGLEPIDSGGDDHNDENEGSSAEQDKTKIKTKETAWHGLPGV